MLAENRCCMDNGKAQRLPMKTKNLIICHFLILNFLIFTVFVFAGENDHVLLKEKLCGTWVNNDYDQKDQHARWDFNPDGTFACYSKLSSESPCWKGSYMISEKWTDNEGKMWFRIFWQDTINLINGYGLIYINQPGSLMEAAHSSFKASFASLDPS